MRRNGPGALADLKAGRIGRHHERADSALAFGGAGEHHVEIGDSGIRNPGLGPVQHVVALAPLRAHGHGGDIRTRFLLREREGRDLPPGGHIAQPCLLLPGVPVQADRRAAENLHRVDKIGQGLVPRQRLAHQAQTAGVEAGVIAERLRYRDLEEPGFAQTRGDVPTARVQVGIGGLLLPGLLAAPGVQPALPVAMPLLEKRPIEVTCRHEWRGYSAACRDSASRISRA